MHEAITEKSIERATTLFWEQMLAMPMQMISQLDEFNQLAEFDQIDAIDQKSIPPRSWVGTPEGLNQEHMTEQHFVGSCNISGAWCGRIEVRLSTSLSIAATAAMLMQPAESVENADILDAVKEIANMTAGTIKSALPRPCVMTVPEAQLATADFSFPQTRVAAVSARFVHAAGALLVRVLEDVAPHQLSVMHRNLHDKSDSYEVAAGLLAIA